MDEMPHILVVDDDRRIRQLLKSYLLENGLRVTLAASAKEARQKQRIFLFDILVLDIMMPGENGLEFAKNLRDIGDQTPILMLTALAESEDRIAGLSVGSDDYLIKPFEPRELLLRLHNLLKRNKNSEFATQTVKFGSFDFHPIRGELMRGTQMIRLTSREKEILRLLTKKRGQTVRRSDLSHLAMEGSTRGVDVQISRLRQKIEVDPANPAYLQTVRGAGYVLHLD